MRFLACVLALCACQGNKSNDKPAPPPPKLADAAIADAAPDWTVACEQALTAKQTPVRKLTDIIEGCQPCGDWTPLLHWATPADKGGPKQQQIEDAMVACKAYCTGDAKMQFQGLLGDARADGTNKPWRVLGEKCKDAVSAVPDVRFMSAPYFALDRIARATAADPKLAPLAAALELPLPPVSITGVGFELPTAAVTKPDPGKFHVTVTLNEMRIGTLPTAKLGKDGVVVDLGKTPYPGELVKDKELAAKLDALAGSPTARITIIAPTAIPASRVADVAKAAGQHELVLAVAATGGPPGWTLPGVVPVVLDAKPAAKALVWKLDAEVDKTIADLKAKPAEAFAGPKITITKTAKVADLAKLLGALAFRDAKTASLAKP